MLPENKERDETSSEAKQDVSVISFEVVTCFVLRKRRRHVEARVLTVVLVKVSLTVIPKHEINAASTMLCLTCR